MSAFEMSHYFIADVFREITMRVLQARTWIWSPQPAFCQHASLGGNQAAKQRTTSWLLLPLVPCSWFWCPRNHRRSWLIYETLNVNTSCVQSYCKSFKVWLIGNSPEGSHISFNFLNRKMDLGSLWGKQIEPWWQWVQFYSIHWTWEWCDTKVMSQWMAGERIQRWPPLELKNWTRDGGQHL